MSAIWFVVIPILCYVALFLVETGISFRRIGKPLDKGGAYLHATWEVTHTFLILGITYFMWLYSSAIVDISQKMFMPLVIFGAVFVIRAILYLYLFYIKQPTKPNLLIDWSFAICHIIMLICLVLVAVIALGVMQNGNYLANEILLPLLYPGLILTFLIICIPIYFLFTTKKQ